LVPARPFLRGKPGCVRSRAALREIEPREVVEAHAQFRLVGAERVFADGEGTLEERLGLRVPALREIEPGEVVEAHAQFRLVGAERVFADGEGTLEERLGLRVPALREIEPREVVEARAHIRVVGAEHLFVDGEGGSELDRKMPPRVRKPLPRNDQWKAPTPDLEGHRKRLREALGNTLSEKLVEALRPGLYDRLYEETLNADLATIDSMQPRSELQALLAVQIIATGFAGLRFLRQSHRQMTEDYINLYGGYAIKLLRLQNEMIKPFERYRRGNKQTVEVRHVHIHSGGQGVVGIINPPDDRDAGVRE